MEDTIVNVLLVVILVQVVGSIVAQFLLHNSIPSKLAVSVALDKAEELAKKTPTLLDDKLVEFGRELNMSRPDPDESIRDTDEGLKSA